MTAEQQQLQDIYQTYLALLQSDPNIKISDVLKMPQFEEFITSTPLTPDEIEQTIYAKIYQEEESAGIQ